MIAFIGDVSPYAFDSSRADIPVPLILQSFAQIGIIGGRVENTRNVTFDILLQSDYLFRLYLILIYKILLILPIDLSVLAEFLAEFLIDS